MRNQIKKLKIERIYFIMETNVKEIDVKTNAYNAGRLYAIYEAIFKESGAG